MIDYLQGAKDGCLFRGKLLECARKIREGYPESRYDHRPFLPVLPPPYHKFEEQIFSEQFRIGYAGFKREVAKVLQPQVIMEIGVGIGISALAFLDGYPAAFYIGLDNDVESGRDFPVCPSQFVSSLLVKKTKKFEILRCNSQDRNKGPVPADLVHVDGDHHRAATKHDVLLAWNSLTPAGYILVDDARDSNVAAGTFDAISELHPGSTDWTYFEDTWTGSILIHKETGRP